MLRHAAGAPPHRDCIVWSGVYVSLLRGPRLEGTELSVPGGHAQCSHRVCEGGAEVAPGRGAQAQRSPCDLWG